MHYENTNSNFLSPKMNNDLIDSELKLVSSKSDFVIKWKINKSRSKSKLHLSENPKKPRKTTIEHPFAAN